MVRNFVPSVINKLAFFINFFNNFLETPQEHGDPDKAKADVLIALLNVLKSPRELRRPGPLWREV